MNFFLEKLITTLLSLLPKEFLTKFLEDSLNYLESQILASDTKIDDSLILPLLERIREELNLNNNIL